MNWSLAFAIVTAVLSGALVTLRVVAPLTTTEKDNLVLRWLEKLEKVLVSVVVPGKYKLPPAP